MISTHLHLYLSINYFSTKSLLTLLHDLVKAIILVELNYYVSVSNRLIKVTYFIAFLSPNKLLLCT